MAPVQIENSSEEAGEEVGLSNHDDGTITSRLFGFFGAKEAKNEDASSTAESESEPDESEPVESEPAESEPVESESKPEDTTSTEDDEKAEEESVTETDEREFDKNPTVLYALVQKKLWKEAIARATTNPKEARAFISRKEKNGKIRWRLLPLHAAVVFKAPEDVIEALLTAYPKAAEEKDDQGMMPLHLAFRNSASAAVVNLLLLAFPSSADIPDRKGRVPLVLAKAAASPNRELYIKALEKGSSYYSVAALASARDRIVAEQKEIFDAQLKETLKFHESAISEMEANAVKKQQEVQDIVLEKEQELAKIHENSQVLVDHVASLEAQMNTRSDTERFLATKIAKLEEKVKGSDLHLQEREIFWQTAVAKAEGKLQETADLKEENQGQFAVQKTMLSATVEGLREELEETKAKLSSTEDKLQASIYSVKEKQDEWEMARIKLDSKFSKVEIDWANSQAIVAILECQVKKRMENEHLLASQVSNLAARLAESADSNMTFSDELNRHEKEKLMLETTVHVLKTRLKNVTAVMESTREHQMAILDNSIAQEEMMAKCMESHAQGVSESIAQEKEMQAAKDEMMALIEKTFNDANENRLLRLNMATGHGVSLTSMNASRSNVLSCAQTVTSNVISALETDLDLDTLSAEVKEIDDKRTSLPKSLADFEIREETEEIKTEETSAEPEEEKTESITNESSTNDSELVVPTSTKVLNVIVASDATSEIEVQEERMEVDIASNDVQVDRVTAE